MSTTSKRKRTSNQAQDTVDDNAEVIGISEAASTSSPGSAEAEVEFSCLPLIMLCEVTALTPRHLDGPNISNTWVIARLDQWPGAVLTNLVRRQSPSQRHYFNAVRHYDTINGKYIKKADVPAPKSSIFSIPPAVVQKREDKQKLFDSGMLKLIAQDGVSLNLCDKANFRELVAILDRNIEVRSRRTYSKNLKAEVEKKVLPMLKQIHDTQKPDLLSYSLDIWTSRIGNSIMGTRCHYINKDWELISRTIGSQSFPERHNGKNIRDKFEELLISLDSNLKNTHYIVTDNASNMVKAFNMNNVFEDPWLGVEDILSGDEESEAAEEEVEQDYEDWVDVDVGSNISDISDDEPAHIRPKFIGCIAHTLQLVVNDAIKADVCALETSKYVERLTAFYRRRSHWRAQLKKRPKKELVKPVKTRWNSLYFALQRLCETEMTEAVSAIKRKIEVEDKAAYKKYPQPPTDCTSEGFNVILSLLKLLQVATDRLQSEKCYISSAMISVLVAFEKVSGVEPGKFETMKDTILNGLKNRFEATVLKEEAYILTSFLDPRCKDSIFKGTCIRLDLDASIAVPRVDTRLRALLDLEFQILKNQNFYVEFDQGVNPGPHGSETSIFSRVQQYAKSGTSEIGRYIEEGIVAATTDPLSYWKLHSTRFPNLGRIARKYLCVPATSGGVERVFSISGSLGRARRAQLTP